MRTDLTKNAPQLYIRPSTGRTCVHISLSVCHSNSACSNASDTSTCIYQPSTHQHISDQSPAHEPATPSHSSSCSQHPSCTYHTPLHMPYAGTAIECEGIHQASGRPHADATTARSSCEMSIPRRLQDAFEILSRYYRDTSSPVRVTSSPSRCLRDSSSPSRCLRDAFEMPRRLRDAFEITSSPSRCLRDTSCSHPQRCTGPVVWMTLLLGPSSHEYILMRAAASSGCGSSPRPQHARRASVRGRSRPISAHI